MYVRMLHTAVLQGVSFMFFVYCVQNDDEIHIDFDINIDFDFDIDIIIVVCLPPGVVLLI